MSVENKFQCLLEAQRIFVLSNIKPETKIAVIYALAEILAQKTSPLIIADLSADRILSESFKENPIESAEFYSRVPKVNKMKCKLCGYCASHCPNNVIQFDQFKSKVLVDIYHCIDCGECYKSCGIKEAIVPIEAKIGAFEIFCLQPSINVLRSSFRRKYHLNQHGKLWLENYASKAKLIIDLDLSLWGKKLIEPNDFIIELVNTYSNNNNAYLASEGKYLMIATDQDQLTDIQFEINTGSKALNDLIPSIKEYLTQILF